MDVNALELFDSESSETEDRYVLLGMSSTPHLLVVVFCERSDDEVRIISARKAKKRKVKTMKKEYDFSKAKKRSKRTKTDPKPAKFPTSIRLDGAVLAWFKTESDRQGVPYQTLISSILHRYAKSELVDKAEVKRLQKIKSTG